MTLVLAGTLVGCGQSPDSKVKEDRETVSEEVQAAVVAVNAAEAMELIGADPGLVIVDLRTPDEFETGHIGGSINIDFLADGFEEELAELDSSRPTIFHCASGNRSGKAQAAFEALGFLTLYHMDSGFKSWETAGLPVVK